MFGKPKCKLTTGELYSEDWKQFKCEMTPPFTCNCCNYGLLEKKNQKGADDRIDYVIIIVILSIKLNSFCLLLLLT